MLLNQGIRTKLLAVLALPILALVVVASAISLQAFGQAGKASQVEQLAQGSATLGRLVSSLQAERTVSVAFLRKRPVAAELKRARAGTDAALAASRTLIGSVDLASLSPQATAAVTAANRSHGQLGALRASVSVGQADAAQISDQYSAIISNDVVLPQRIGEGLADRAIGSQLTAYSLAQQIAELATLERETGLTIIAARTVDSVNGAALAKVAALQAQATTTFSLDATPAQTRALDAALERPTQARASYRDLQQAMLTAGTGRRLRLDASTWRNAANDRLIALQALAQPIAASAGEQAATSSASARTRAFGVLAGGGLLVAVLVLLGSVLSRTITGPLRHLTEIAGRMRDELPLMVERMATPGQGPGITMPDIPTGANDEVGQLARAFRDVNATTVRVAEEQAALRASIAEMFVNVARRNHVLLSRQLSFIDQLERTEEDPDTLENLFRLDHLATRMRRNAESLIVLAGIDAGRRLRRPMPLSDVIRTAVSEIERYDRVDLALQADPPMVGHVALTCSHLLAELLENATQFSNPDTRVITSTAFTSRGVRVTVTDLGLGMTWDEISDANERIANPPMSDVVGSQRLGFYVVGRLARRLDATVELKPGRAHGTIITIDLPPGLFVAGTVIEIPVGPDEQLEPTPGPDDVTDLTVTSTQPLPSGPPSVAPAVVPGRSSDLAQRGSARPQPMVAAPVAKSAPVSLEPVAAVQDSAAAVLPIQLASPQTAMPPVAFLPRPGSREAPPSVDAAATQAPASGSRTGIFSGFRARREATPPPAATGAAALAEIAVEDSATTFVPVIERAAEPAADVHPDLPQRGLPRRDTHADPIHPPVALEPVVAPEPSVVIAPVIVEPAVVIAPLIAEPAVFTLPVRAPGPLDDGWFPVEPEAVAVVEPAPTMGLLLEPVAVVLPEPEPAPVAPEPVAVVLPEPVVVADPQPATPTLDVPARSALTELAQDVQPVGEPEREPEVRRPSPVGVASMDILPTRSASRGLRLRRPGRSKPAPLAAPAREVVTAFPAPSPQAAPGKQVPSGSAPSSQVESFPFAGSSVPETFIPTPNPTPLAEPAETSVFGTPFTEPEVETASTAGGGGIEVTQVATPGHPIAAPPSLFVTAPAPALLPLRESAHEPAPVPVAARPVLAEPAVPVLAAAPSLRERSAMASEALSELSALSTYRPESQQSAPAGLVRRTPQATPAGQLPPVEEPTGARRPNRNAADVRSMLSGFQAGVERGRTSPAAGRGPNGEPVRADE